MYRLIVIAIMTTTFGKSNKSVREFNQEELDMIKEAVITQRTIKKHCPCCGAYQREETITVCEITLTTGRKRLVLADRVLPQGKINIKELAISTNNDTGEITLIPNENSETSKYKQKAIRDFIELLLA